MWFSNSPQSDTGIPTTDDSGSKPTVLHAILVLEVYHVYVVLFQDEKGSWIGLCIRHSCDFQTHDTVTGILNNRRFRLPYTILHAISTRPHSLYRYCRRISNQSHESADKIWKLHVIMSCHDHLYIAHRNRNSRQPTIPVQTHRSARDTRAGSVPCVWDNDMRSWHAIMTCDHDIR